MSDRRDGHLFRIQFKDDHGNVVGETDAVSFKGLLALAHDEDLSAIETTLVQIPTEDNRDTAIVQATVRTRRGSFTALGDANPDNVSRAVSPHFLRCAETRAISRALRLAVNVAEVAVDELSDSVSAERRMPRSIDSTDHAPPSRELPPAPPLVHQAAAPLRLPTERFRGRDTTPDYADPADRRAMSEDQKKLVFRLIFELGASRETARDEVLRALGVQRLEHATRVDASRAIDLLKRERERRGTATGNNGTSNGANPHG